MSNDDDFDDRDYLSDAALLVIVISGVLMLTLIYAMTM